MRVMIGRFVVPEAAQRFDHGALRLRLARVDHVVDLGHVAEVGMLLLALHRRDPALMLIGIAIKLAIPEIAPEQAELPHVIGDVFADIADGPVGTDDDFLVFLGNLLRLWILYALCRGWF